MKSLASIQRINPSSKAGERSVKRWLIDFENYTIDQQPSDLVKLGNENSYAVKSTYAQGTKSLLITASTQAHAFCYFSDTKNTPTHGDLDITMKVYSPGAMGQRYGLMFRIHDDNGTIKGYCVMLRDTNTFRLSEMMGGTSEVVIATNTVPAFTHSTWYNIRVRAVGPLIKAKYWKDGDAEPADWSLSATDYTFDSTKKSLGIYCRTDNVATQYFDNICATEIAAPTPTYTDFTQPALPSVQANDGWPFNSIDLQVVTKSNSWNQSQDKRLAEYDEIISKGAEYAAIAVPYNNLTKYANYVADARTKGLKVFHRAHWDEWEGDNSVSGRMGRLDYLRNTYNFIINNPTLFADGDLFGACVEPNNANNNGNYTFRTPETSGGSFSISKYNQFLKDLVSWSNNAFKAINKSVYTFPISGTLSLLDLAGQTLDSGEQGNASGLDNNDIVQYFGGILAIDHYLSGSYDSGDNYGTKFSSDLDKIHAAFPDCYLFIGEWGYPTEVSASDAEQDTVFNEVVDVLKSKSYICGVNFWVHMASNTASLWTDSSGTIVSGGRTATAQVLDAFTSSNSFTP